MVIKRNNSRGDDDHQSSTRNRSAGYSSQRHRVLMSYTKSTALPVSITTTTTTKMATRNHSDLFCPVPVKPMIINKKEEEKMIYIIQQTVARLLCGIDYARPINQVYCSVYELPDYTSIKPRHWLNMVAGFCAPQFVSMFILLWGVFLSWTP